jgi:CRISPR-associated protein Csd1
MILQRLYELAQREKLLDDPAFEELPVPYVVMVGDDGQYLGFTSIRGTVTIPAKKKDAPPKTVPDKGKLLKVPRAHGSPANQGFARFFVDTLPRVLPLIVEEKDQKKADASRKSFWEQIDTAADGCDDPALKALHAFGRRFEEFTARIRTDVEKEDPVLTDRVTFAYRGSDGPTVLELDPVRKWYSTLFAKLNANKQSDGQTGVCQVTCTVGPIPTSHPTKLQGVPGGMSVGVSLISFDKAAFGHYGFDGAENAALGYAATDGYLRALDALLKNNLPSVKARGGKSKLVVGGTAFLYWTKEPIRFDVMNLVDDPAEEPMRQLLDSVRGGKNRADTLDATPFYMLALSGNSARAIVRGYLETTLGEAKANVLKWFKHLRIADSGKDFAGAVNDRFPLWQLTLATAFDSAAVAPETGERLLTAALTGGPVPVSLLTLCLRRLIAEGSDAFRANRMALIKLILTRREIKVSEQLDPDEHHPAYVYGRLLAVFEQIQYAALGDVNANVVDKFYGTMSSAPGMVVGRLQDNARNHLRKIRGDKPGTGINLEKRLMEVLGLLGATPPPSQLSLQDQGRFALGYYHEKAKRFEAAAERKAENAAKAETK